MKTPQQAATNYKTNGTNANALNAWAADFIAQMPTMFANAKKQIPYWQQQVSTAQAAQNMSTGLDKASQNQGAIATKVNGPGKNSLSAGITAASTGKYLDFANEFLPAVAGEVQTLDRTNPRGTKADNRARLLAYLDWLDTQAGNFRQ